MKVLVIGDTHGEDWWKSVVFGAEALANSYFDNNGISHENFRFIKEKIDKVVFVGDYMDSFFVQPYEQMENLREIVMLANAFPDKFELLLGNHDIHYIYPEYRCSGFKPELWHQFKDVYEENKKLFKAAYMFGDYLVTHAGLTQGMWKICEKKLKESKHLYDYTDPEKTIADHINFLFEIHFEPLFYAGFARGGLSPTPGIFWADKSELIKDPKKGCSQIVGHTPLRQKDMRALEGGHTLWFIDLMNVEAWEIIDTDPETNVYSPNTRSMTY